MADKKVKNTKFNKIFKQNNAGQIKGNTTKLEYTNYGKNVNGSSFSQKFLI